MISSSSSIDLLSSSSNEVERGVFIDSRDGQEYAYISIGNQIWMTENLKYLPQVDLLSAGSEDSGYEEEYFYYVYDYTPSGASEAEEVSNAKATNNYQAYGVLYNWYAAMGGAPSSASNPSGVQGVCPDGWHLPSDVEWRELSDFVDLDNDGDASNNNEGESLKAISTWSEAGNGTDTYGFSALAGGYRDSYNMFGGLEYFSYWWSTADYDEGNAYYRYLYYATNELYRSFNYKDNAYYVRCVMD
jgi:uncharacterized protein (TIGR02145 family)